MKHLLLVLGKKYGDHFLSVCKTFLPVMIVKVLFNIFFTFCLVFPYYELIEWIFKDSLKDPLAQDLEIRLSAFLEEKFK
jgi:hypothetical protein